PCLDSAWPKLAVAGEISDDTFGEHKVDNEILLVARGTFGDRPGDLPKIARLGGVAHSIVGDGCGLLAIVGLPAKVDAAPLKGFVIAVAVPSRRGGVRHIVESPAR